MDTGVCYIYVCRDSNIGVCYIYMYVRIAILYPIDAVSFSGVFMNPKQCPSSVTVVFIYIRVCVIVI